MLRQDGRKAPDLDRMKPQHWEHVLELPSKSARKRYYQFLWQNDLRNESRDAKKEIKREENVERLARERKEKAQNPHIVYGLYHNTMFMRIYDDTITKFHNRKLLNAMMFEQKLVIDCSYDEHMNPREASNTGKQLMLCFAENRMHDEPFDLQFCNVNLDSIASRTLNKFIPTMLNDDFPMNIHTESFTEKFDKKRLVYLTPHCNNDLEVFDPDDIYIIGAMVDKTNNEPLSLAKAKKQGLRMARLPLDRYLQWGAGSGKSLTLNQMVNIMLEMKKHGDWNEALKYVPRRKLADEEERPFARPHSINVKKFFNDSQDHRSNDSRPYQQRQRFNNRQEFQSDTRRPSYDDREQQERRPFNNSRSFDNRRNNDDQEEPRRRSFDNSRSFDSRRNADDREPSDQPYRRSYFNNSQSNENRRNFDDPRRRSFDNRRSFDDEESSQPPARRFSFDNLHSNNNRRNFDDRESSEPPARRSSFENSRSNNRRDFDDREPSEPPARRENSRSTDNRRSYDDQNSDQPPRRSFNNSQSYDRRNSSDQEFPQSSFDKSRSFKERKHFDKFKFDLSTWGSKMDHDKKYPKKS